LRIVAATSVLLAATTCVARAQTPPIQHVIIIMQEKRSFDAYFGTFPGADGIPMINGVPSVCVPDPATGTCVAPYHTDATSNTGGPVSPGSTVTDVDGGAMDGFIRAAEAPAPEWPGGGCGDPAIAGCTIDVMSYRDSREIPNYWAYAENFVLQDHMFAGTTSYGLPAHLELLSGWSAECSGANPFSCANELSMGEQSSTPDAWTDLTYLLSRAGVSWGYYAYEPAGAAATCGETLPKSDTPSMWNPLPCFLTVTQDGQLGNIKNIGDFYTQAAAGTLPSVSWVAPNWIVSEHQSYPVSAGQAFVTGVINAVMQGPDWASAAIFVSYADWGGYYDHERPPVVDSQGYGLRVPGWMISPYAKAGLIDHQILSHDAYLKFIEDLFLGGQRLDPATDGRPDPRPDVRENAPILGDLMSEFDFTQTPLPPLVLPTNPGTGPTPASGR
jgi:phospholipase C